MATAHIESKKEDIAKIVLFPGDPLRAKYIAEKFLTNVKLVNSVRDIFGYTGYYKDRMITDCDIIISNDKDYDVEKIIRIGTCGTMHPDIKLMDVVLAEKAFSFSSFPLLFDGDTEKEYASTDSLNKLIINKAEEKNISLKIGKVITSDVFDPYVDAEKFMSNFPKEDFVASEMEAFGLFYLAYKLNKEATCLLTVVDSKYDDRSLSSEDREKSLDEMILLALDSVI